jgi:glycine betaine/proline transport system ATP-binding protein
LKSKKFAGDVEADDNLESLIALSEGDTALTYRVMSDGEPIGELNMRDLVKALVPRISSTQAA